MKRGLVCIATGAYVGLVDALVTACADADFVDEIFCLTDSADLLTSPGGSTRSGSVTLRVLPWGGLPWPYPTLWRYHAMAQYWSVFAQHVTHLIYSDVDMRPLTRCDALFGRSLVAVRHPGYWNSGSDQLPFERRTASRAIVSPGDVQARYVAGGIQGGPVQEYGEAVRSLRDAILEDFTNGITAAWHDESHWNAFVARSPGLVDILGPEYCWPESWPVPEALGEPRVLALDKDHHALRGTNPTLQERYRPNRARLRRLVGELRPSLLRAHQ